MSNPLDDTTDETTHHGNVIDFKAEYEASKQRIKMLEAENSALRVRVQAAETEANFHPLTELANKRLFDRELSGEILALLSSEPAQKLMGGEHPVRLTTSELDEIAFTVAMLDLSYLTLLNTIGGHDLGNTALISLASALRQTITIYPTGLATAYHWGGDEFALICRGNARTADEILRNATVRYRSLPIYPDPTLRPSADFGTAMLAEALWVYGYFAKNYPALAPTNPRDVLTCILEMLRDVADERAIQNKTTDRFLLLAELCADGHGMYDLYFPHFTRGSTLLTREHIKAAARLPAGTHRNRHIHMVVNTDLKAQLDRSLRQAESLTGELGAKAAKRHLVLRMAIRRWRFDTPIR